MKRVVAGGCGGWGGYGGVMRRVGDGVERGCVGVWERECWRVGGEAHG